jgi:large subunit ribosomal protein L10
LIGKVVGGFKSPLYGLVNVLNGPARKLVYALDAIRKQKGGE